MASVWAALPDDLGRLICRGVARDAARRVGMRHAAARRIQAAYRRYRALVLLGRFRMLRYLHDFRDWNPDLAVFLRRSRL